MKDIIFEKGSGNVFTDLGLTDADELYVRAQIGFGVFEILKNRKLKQRAKLPRSWGFCSPKYPI
jgi:predicted XRE-type DNA-binding protein